MFVHDTIELINSMNGMRASSEQIAASRFYHNKL